MSSPGTIYFPFAQRFLNAVFFPSSWITCRDGTSLQLTRSEHRRFPNKCYLTDTVKPRGNRIPPLAEIMCCQRFSPRLLPVSRHRALLGCFPEVSVCGFKSSKAQVVEAQRQGTETIKWVHYWFCWLEAVRSAASAAAQQQSNGTLGSGFPGTHLSTAGICPANPSHDHLLEEKKLSSYLTKSKHTAYSL